MFLSIFLFILPAFILSAIYRKPSKAIIHYLISAGIFLFLFFVILDRGVRWFHFHLFFPTFRFYAKVYLQIFFISLSLHFLKCRINRVSFKLKKHLTASAVLSFTGAFFTFGLIWASSRFPIHQSKTVFSVLTGGVEGGVSPSIISSFMVQVLCPSILLSVLLVFFSKHSERKNIFPAFTTVRFSLDLFFTAAFLIFAAGFLSFLFIMKPYKFIGYYIQSQKPAEFSLFYENEYVDAKKVNVTFPKKKRNLIYIMMESMESSFSDYSMGGKMNVNLIPKLTKLAEENINFSATSSLGGGIQAEATGWTIAGFVSKFAGIPFKLPTSKNPGNMRYFLPKARTLTDILSENGYSQVFICGSDKKFASRDVFFESHGNVEVHDINYYKQVKKLPKPYFNGFWGFEDQKLYQFAKEDILSLAAKDQPFAVTILTVDTHYPAGYKCQLCPQTFSTNDKEDELKNIILCADNQVYDFVNWIREQDFYEDTLIVITGDHLFMQVPYITLYDDADRDPENKFPRYWLDIFINSSVKPEEGREKLRTFTSFDIYPTVLEALGAEVQGRTLGFGRSLFSSLDTIAEKYTLREMNGELAKKTVQFEELLKN